MQKTNEHRMFIKEQLESCHQRLLELQETCCIDKRSVHMQTLLDSLNAFGKRLDRLSSDEAMMPNDIIGEIEKVGAALGILYATCCTPTREPIYAAMFSALSRAHLRVLRIKGGGH